MWRISAKGESIKSKVLSLDDQRDAGAINRNEDITESKT